MNGIEEKQEESVWGTAPIDKYLPLFFLLVMVYFMAHIIILILSTQGDPRIDGHRYIRINENKSTTEALVKHNNFTKRQLETEVSLGVTHEDEEVKISRSHIYDEAKKFELQRMTGEDTRDGTFGDFGDFGEKAQKVDKNDEFIIKSEETLEVVRHGEYKVTAYCPCIKCTDIYSYEHPNNKHEGFIQKTASGTIPKENHTIAADWNVFPAGTKLVLNGKEYTVEDRGGAINGKKIDVYFNSHQDALDFGVRYLDVFSVH